MPPRKKKNPIDDVVNAMVTEAIGEVVPPTAAQIVAEHGGLAEIDRFSKLASKCVKASPSYARQIFAQVDRYCDFVEEHYPEYSAKSASIDVLPRQFHHVFTEPPLMLHADMLSAYLGYVVRVSRDTAKPRILPDGSKEPRYMADTTLHAYRVKIQKAVGCVSTTKDTSTDHAQVMLFAYPRDKAKISDLMRDIGLANTHDTLIMLKCRSGVLFGCWLGASWVLAGCWLGAGWVLAGYYFLAGRRITSPQITFKLIEQFKLARDPQSAYTLGPGEVRLLLENLFGNEYVSAGSLQHATLLLLFLFTGARRGSLVSTTDWPHNYLEWQDVTFRLSNREGSVEGVDLYLILRHLKAHQIQNKKRYISALSITANSLRPGSIKFNIMSMRLRKNVIFDLALCLLGHAYRSKVLVGSELPFADLFKAENKDQLKIKPERLGDPVFYRQVKGQSQALDLSGPIHGDSVSRITRRLLAETGLQGDGQDSLKLYGFRRGFLTAAYSDSRVGPAFARQLAGHAADSVTLEDFYVQGPDGVAVTDLLGLGEESGFKPATAAQLRNEAPFLAKTSAQWAAADVRYAFLTKVITSLALSLTLGNSTWKELPPFNDKPEFQAYDIGATHELLKSWRRLADNRLKELKGKELEERLRGSEPARDRLEVSEIGEKGSVLIDSTLQRLYAEAKKDLAKHGTIAEGAEADDGYGGADGELEVFPQEALLEDQTDADVDEEEGFEDGGDSPLEVDLLTLKLAYMQPKVSPSSIKAYCLECKDDESAPPYCRGEFNPYALSVHQRQYHTPQHDIKRWLQARGMAYIHSGKSMIAASEDEIAEDRVGEECGYLSNGSTFWRHLLDKHSHELQRDHLRWLEDFVHVEKQRTKQQRTKTIARPKHLDIAYDAPPHLPFGYDVLVKNNRAPVAISEVRQLFSPSYSIPSASPIGLPEPADAMDDISRAIAQRLLELRASFPESMLDSQKRISPPGQAHLQSIVDRADMDVSDLVAAIDQYKYETM
ncbi:hypothetical protein P7C73_g1095, partial [Tremellales sp. Uapishka_1]